MNSNTTCCWSNVQRLLCCCPIYGLCRTPFLKGTLFRQMVVGGVVHFPFDAVASLMNIMLLHLRCIPGMVNISMGFYFFLLNDGNRHEWFLELIKYPSVQRAFSRLLKFLIWKQCKVFLLLKLYILWSDFNFPHILNALKEITNP